MQAWMNIGVDDAQAAFRGGFLFEQGAVDDVTHALLLGRLMRRGSAAARFQADCRHTGAIRYWPADAAVSRRRREWPVRIIWSKQERIVAVNPVDEHGNPVGAGRSVASVAGQGKR